MTRGDQTSRQPLISANWKMNHNHFEAIQAVGEDEFVRQAEELARDRLRDGLPLRAPIDVVGYLARKP